MDRLRSNDKFLMYKCDLRFGQKIENLLNAADIIIESDWKPEHYRMISKRCYNIYSRLKQYPANFLSQLKDMKMPGAIIYAVDGENIDLPNLKKKRVANDGQLRSIFAEGKNVMFFGDTIWDDYDCYITQRRLNKEKSGDAFFSTLPLFDPSLLKESPNPFSGIVLKVGALSLLSDAPKYLSALDVIIPGTDIFNTHGLIDIPRNLYCRLTRRISVNGLNNSTKVIDITQVKSGDKLVVAPSFILSDTEEAFQHRLRKELRAIGGRVIGASGMTFVKITCANGSTYFLTTTMRIDDCHEFNDMGKFIRFLLCSFNFGEKVSLIGCLPVVLTTIDEVPYVMSDAMTIAALKKRRTFLNEQSMNIAIIGNKGSFKSTFLEMFQELNDSYKSSFVQLIDSDTYGKWILEKMVNPGYKYGDVLTEDLSYFETLMQNLIIAEENCVVRKKVFGDEYIRILLDEEHGLTQFQIEVGRFYGTGKRIVLFCHSIPEANCLSGNWQQFVLDPPHNARYINYNRDAGETTMHVDLYDVYDTIGPARDKLQWVELLAILFPDVLQSVVREGL